MNEARFISQEKLSRKWKVTPVLLGALLLAGCATLPASNKSHAPITASWYSEFKREDAELENPFAAFLSATLAQQDDQLGKSAAYFADAVADNPGSKFVADRAFIQQVYAGDISQAVSLAREIRATEEGQADDLVQLVNALEAFKQKEWPAVRERLDRPLTSGFGFLLVPLLKAWSHTGEGDYENALEALSPLINDERLQNIAKEHAAYMLDFLGETEKAHTAYEELLEGNRTSLQPIVSYAHFLRRNGERGRASEFLREQIKLYNNNQYLLVEAARMTTNGAPAQVLTNPHGAMSGIFYRLASEFSRGSSPQSALIYYRLASYMTPEQEQIHLLIGSVFERLNNPDSAVAAYRVVEKSPRLGGVARSSLVSALQQAGRDEEAIEILRTILTRSPNNRNALVTLGNIYSRQGQYVEAADYFSKVIDAITVPVESDWLVYFSRGDAYQNIGNWERAEADLKIALRLNGDEPTILNYLGYSWIDRKVNIDEAKSMIERAVASRPDDGYFADSLGWVYFLTGDYRQAVATLEKAVRLEPDDATINDHLGDAYWKVGRKIEARFQWRHALDSDPDDDERRNILDKLDNGLSSDLS